MAFDENVDLKVVGKLNPLKIYLKHIYPTVRQRYSSVKSNAIVPCKHHFSIVAFL